MVYEVSKEFRQTSWIMFCSQPVGVAPFFQLQEGSPSSPNPAPLRNGLYHKSF